MMRSRFIPTIFLVASIAALTSAYIMEYGFTIMPCKLCTYQRFIYFISTIFSFLGIVCPGRLVIIILVISYILNMLVAGYQVAIEKHWIDNFISCSVVAYDLSTLTDQEILDLTLGENEIPSCDFPALVVFGISIAGWSFLYCCVVLIVSFLCKRRYEVTSK